MTRLFTHGFCLHHQKKEDAASLRLLCAYDQHMKALPVDKKGRVDLDALDRARCDKDASRMRVVCEQSRSEVVFEPEDRMVAVVGAGRSGKTVMLALLRQELQALNDGLGPIPFVAPQESREHLETIARDLTVGRDHEFPLPPPNPVSDSRPILLEIPDAETHLGDRARDQILTYDLPGEAAANLKSMIEYWPHLLWCKRLMILIDPGIVPELSQQMPGDRPTSAEVSPLALAQALVDYYRRAEFSDQKPGLWGRLRNRLKRHKQKKIDVDVALVLTKCDELESLEVPLLPYDLASLRERRSYAGRELARLVDDDRQADEWFVQQPTLNQVVRYLDQFFPHVKCFFVSALGKRPERIARTAAVPAATAAAVPLAAAPDDPNSAALRSMLATAAPAPASPHVWALTRPASPCGICEPFIWLLRAR